MTALTVTAKGQITLKRDLLRHLNVAPGQKVEVNMLPNGRLVLDASEKSGSIDAFIGILRRKDGPRLSIEEINRITADTWAGKL